MYSSVEKMSPASSTATPSGFLGTGTGLQLLQLENYLKILNFLKYFWVLNFFSSNVFHFWHSPFLLYRTCNLDFSLAQLQSHYQRTTTVKLLICICDTMLVSKQPSTTSEVHLYLHSVWSSLAILGSMRCVDDIRR